MAVLVGVGGGEAAGLGGRSLGAAVAMVGRDGDYFTPGTQGVIRFNQLDKNRLDREAAKKYFFNGRSTKALSPPSLTNGRRDFLISKKVFFFL